MLWNGTSNVRRTAPIKLVYCYDLNAIAVLARTVADQCTYSRWLHPQLLSVLPILLAIFMTRRGLEPPRPDILDHSQSHEVKKRAPSSIARSDSECRQRRHIYAQRLYLESWIAGETLFSRLLPYLNFSYLPPILILSTPSTYGPLIALLLGGNSLAFYRALDFLSPTSQYEAVIFFLLVRIAG